jgi:carnitine 3-dehydrogenase
MTDASKNITHVALIGLGTVGLGWAANYLAKGFCVRAADPAPNAASDADRFLRGAWPSLIALGLTSNPTYPAGRMKIVQRVADALAGAQIVHENAPEDVDLKRKVLSEIEDAIEPAVIIASSSGGIRPSLLQTRLRHPSRFLITHPFNPPHLVPLVEVLGGEQTSLETIDWMMDFMRALGKHPIRIEKERTAYLTNRLQFALVREAVNCLTEGVASAQSIEDAVRYGLAPRWMVMGSLMTLNVAGGPGGMQNVLEKFSGAIESWWDDLGQPRMTADVKAKLLGAAVAIAAGRDVSDWISWRDKNLVRVLMTTADIDRDQETTAI